MTQNNSPATSQKKSLATIQEIIDDAKNGKMFILVDDENSEGLTQTELRRPVRILE